MDFQVSDYPTSQELASAASGCRICLIIRVMDVKSIFLPFLMLCLLTFRQTPEQNAAHIRAWTERHEQYMSVPRIEESESFLDITANDPRPLDGVLAALAHQHGWHINYEDPQYGKSDIVDQTAPSWLEQHPNGPRAYGIAGGAFHVKVPIDGYFPDDPMQILPPLVEAYNRSGNPGRFQLRVVSKNSFDVIPTESGDGPQTPLLDTVMSFDATDDVGAYPTLRKFCEELSRKSGHTVVFGGTGSPSENRLLQAHIKQHSVNQPAREILREMYKQVGSTDCWRLFYDPDSNQFWQWMRSW